MGNNVNAEPHRKWIDNIFFWFFVCMYVELVNKAGESVFFFGFVFLFCHRKTAPNKNKIQNAFNEIALLSQWGLCNCMSNIWNCVSYVCSPYLFIDIFPNEFPIYLFLSMFKKKTRNISLFQFVQLIIRCLCWLYFDSEYLWYKIAEMMCSRAYYHWPSVMCDSLLLSLDILTFSSFSIQTNQ